MKQVNLYLAFLLTMLLVGNTGSYAQEKSSSVHAVQIKKLTKQQANYTCPMHPEVTSNKQGDCPKCGMKLVKSESSENSSVQDKIHQAKSLIKEVKDELIESGKYSCCTNSSCNVCAMEHQSCDCYKNLKAGKDVCNECYGGWQRGDGVDKKIKTSSVKTSYKKHNH